MKKFKVFTGGLWLVSLLVVCASVMTSCSKDDDETIDKSKLVGTWECTYYEEWDKENGVLVYQADASEYVGETITFNADRTYVDNLLNPMSGYVGSCWYWAEETEYDPYDQTYDPEEKNMLFVIWRKGTSINVEPVAEMPVVRLDQNTLVFEGSYNKNYEGVRFQYYFKAEFKRVK